MEQILAGSGLQDAHFPSNGGGLRSQQTNQIRKLATNQPPLNPSLFFRSRLLRSLISVHEEMQLTIVSAGRR